jgi:hypothetical protein
MDQTNNINTQKSNKDSIKGVDTTTIINNAKTVFLVQEKLKDPVAKETDWTSLFFPLIIALVVARFSYYINKRKTDSEIEKLKGETKKTDAEIQKLITENEKLKKSFQPIVIATLQSIQDKVIPSKIDALKLLVQLKNELMHYEQQYCEGDPIVPDLDEFLRLMFFNFEPAKYYRFKEFHDNYSYLFPDNVFEILKKLKIKISAFNESKKSFDSVCDYTDEPSGVDKKKFLEISDLYDEAVLAIRKDCHLDTSFIHDFIEQNK